MLSDKEPFKISVILSAYNTEKYIEEAIHSILNQSYSNIELLIADDKSKDNTKALIDNIKDPRIKCFHNKVNMGKTATVQKLFAFATGQLVTIHDADDVSVKDRFRKQAQAFIDYPNLGMCGTSFISVSENGLDVLQEVRMPQVYEEIIRDIPIRSQFHGPTMLIKKNILDELGEIYRPFFKNNYEDTDLAYRIVEKHFAFNLPEFLYRYRILPNSLCRLKVDVWNRNLYKVVAFLAYERAESGTDSIQRGDLDIVYSYFNKVTAHYQADSALIHREAAAYFIYWKLYKQALKESCKAIQQKPFALVNWRTLFYCSRKSLKNYLFKKA